MPVLPVLTPPEPEPLVTGPLLLVVAVEADVPTVVVEPPAVLLTAPVALVPVLPGVVVPVPGLPFTLASAPESSLQPQGKQRTAKTGKHRDLSMQIPEVPQLDSSLHGGPKQIAQFTRV